MMAAAKSSPKSAGNKEKAGGTPGPATTSFGILDIVRALTGLALISTVASYLVTHGESFIWGLAGDRRPWWTDPQSILLALKGPILLTNEELAAYDGSKEGTPIYLALNRTIYDVSSSPHIYGPGGAYSTLAAKDASRSYITTCFDPVDDLVPYFGGVEEIYVPLWLSKKPPKDELAAITGGNIKMEIHKGKDTEDVLEDIRRSIGFAKFRKLQREAYEKANERVRQQVKTWEGMFAKKRYPIVGKVVGVNETNPKLWKDLKFCEAAKKQRPSFSDSLVTEMEKLKKSTMKLDMGKAPDKKKKPAGKPKKAKKIKDDDAEPERPPMEEEEDIYAAYRTGHANNPKASANVHDMLPGGKYGLKEEDLERILKREDGDDPLPEAIQNILSEAGDDTSEAIRKILGGEADDGAMEILKGMLRNEGKERSEL